MFKSLRKNLIVVSGSFALMATSASANGQKILLFLDLDDAPQEIAAARKVAEANDEILQVVPDVDDVKRRDIDQEASALNYINSLLSKASGDQACKLEERKELLANALSENMRPYRFNKAMLIEKFRDVVRNNDQVTTMITSGHSDGCFITGDFGAFSRGDMGDALNAVPQIKNQVRNLAIAGCYGNTIYNGQKWWRLFGNLDLLAGWNDPAPSRTEGSSPELLSLALTNRTQFTQASSLDDFNNAFKTIGARFKELKYDTAKSPSIMTRQYYASQQFFSTYEGIQNTCSEANRKKLALLIKSYRAYLTADQPGYQNVPDNTSSGPLRLLYTNLQQYAHCSFTFPEASSIDEGELPYAKELSTELNAKPNRERIIELILYRNIVKNFGIYNADQIRNIKSILAQYNAPLSVRPPDFSSSSTSRKNVIDFENALSSYLSRSAPQNGQDRAALYNFEKSLRNVTTLNCVPFNWVEPTVSRRELQPQGDCNSFQGGFKECDTDAAAAQPASARFNGQHPSSSQPQNIVHKQDAVTQTLKELFVRMIEGWK